mgnify:FL=1
MNESLYDLFKTDMLDACFKALNKDNKPFTPKDDSRLSNCYARYFDTYRLILTETRRIAEENAAAGGRK